MKSPSGSIRSWEAPAVHGGGVLWLAMTLTVALLLAPAGSRAASAEGELPEGEGKRILVASCTSCHDLTEVTKFRGYYDRAQWRDIVVTMKEYGATVDARQVEVLADYLAQHLGKQAGK